MGAFSDGKVFGMTIRESANDGSDFTSPDADYRRLFLGEDGLLHVKDSSGTVTDPFSAGSGAPTDATYLTSTANGSLSSEVVVGSAVTLERAAAAVSDHVVMYDASAGAFRGLPVGFTRIGRGHTVIASDCFLDAITDKLEGGVTAYASGAGAAVAVGTGEGSHPGVVYCTTGTTTTGRIAFGNGNTTHWALGAGKVRVGLVAKLETLSDGTNTYTARMGIQDAFAGDSTDGIYFRYGSALNGGEWQGVSRAGGVETALDTNTAADTNWHTFEFEVNAAGTSVEFFIDGTSVGTNATNLPTGAVCGIIPVQLLKSAGATARRLFLDAYWYQFEFTTAR